MITIYAIGDGRHPCIDFPALLQKFKNEFMCDDSRAARSDWV
jgi:hypothetical protein